MASFFGLLGLISAHGNEATDLYADHHRGMMYGSYGTGFMAFGWLFSALVLVALVLLIVWLIKQIQTPSRRKR